MGLLIKIHRQKSMLSIKLENYASSKFNDQIPIVNKKAFSFKKGFFKLNPAAFYSPTQSPMQYHRR